nr:TetM/TetW/TetO/TetS family tetracycline resistance ribosomal protection protein [bacterium]
MRNIGVVAHVDAGKTTLVEQMLYLSGGIRTPGSVDSGTAHTDTLPIERERGISVRAADTFFPWKGEDIQLIDTPGHADFAAEVSRALWALDGAVVVVSAVEGVQAQTEIYCQALQEAGIPFLIFINKIDRIGADAARVIDELAALGIPRPLPLCQQAGDGVQALSGEALEAAVEEAALVDEGLLEEYLSGDGMPLARLMPALARRTHALGICPVLMGCALRGQGVREVLDAIVTLLPPPPPDSGQLSGVVYMVEHDRMGRAAHVRLFGGKLENRDTLPAQEPDGAPRIIAQIRKPLAGKRVDTGILRAGEIGVVYGLTGIKAGDVLGDPALLAPQRRPRALAQPLLSARATAPQEQLPRLRQALEELAAEDPFLNLRYYPEVKELHVQLTGAIQIEVLEAVLHQRFSLDAHLDKPTLLYRETLSAPVEGHIAYTMPKPCWAVLTFRMTPGPRGSGIQYIDSCPSNRMGYRYRKQVEQTLPRALEQGRLGWPVTDVIIELIDGEDHHIHTHPLDFVVATPMAIQNGLAKAQPMLLEPMLCGRFTVPSACAGRLMADLARMRADFGAPTQHGDHLTLPCRVPAATCLDYAVELASYTGGRGVMALRPDGYQGVDVTLGQTAPRRGVDPLDVPRYILAARGALTGAEYSLFS